MGEDDVQRGKYQMFYCCYIITVAWWVWRGRPSPRHELIHLLPQTLPGCIHGMTYILYILYMWSSLDTNFTSTVVAARWWCTTAERS